MTTGFPSARNAESFFLLPSSNSISKSGAALPTSSDAMPTARIWSTYPQVKLSVSNPAASAVTRGLCELIPVPAMRKNDRDTGNHQDTIQNGERRQKENAEFQDASTACQLAALPRHSSYGSWVQSVHSCSLKVVVPTSVEVPA